MFATCLVLSLLINGTSHGADLALVPSLVPESRMNETARVVEAELYSREAKLKNRIEQGNVEDNSGGGLTAYISVHILYSHSQYRL